MKFVTRISIIFCVATCILSDVFEQEDERAWCENCMKINTTCYNVSELFDLPVKFRKKIVIPKMAIHHKKSMLYFSFEPKISDPEYYKIGYISLDNQTQFGILKPDNNQAYNFGTFAIDEDNGIIYTGGSAGIYKKDTNSNTFTSYSSLGDTILSIFFKGNVFFTVYPKGNIIQKRGSDFLPLKGFENEFVKDFVIDKYDVTYFLGVFGLFARKGGVTVMLSDNAFFRGIAMDRNNEVYVWWLDGIYKVKKHVNFNKYALVKISSLSTIGGLTFDINNNMIVVLGTTLMKLTPAKNSQC